MQSLIQRIERFKILHLLVWLAYFFLWYFVYYEFYTDKTRLTVVVLVYLIAHAGAFYSIQYFLVPRLFKRGRYVPFILSLLLTIVLFTFLLYGGVRLILERDMSNYFGPNAFQTLISLFFSLIFICAILMVSKGAKDYLLGQRKREWEEKERLESELQYLKAQLNPHFLFNSINSVYHLIHTNPELAAETLIKLSDLLRAQLYEFRDDMISMNKELSYLHNYIALEKLRKGDRLSVDFEIGEGVEQIQIPPLLLIPLLENCFKHLSNFKNQQNQVSITLKFNDDQLIASFTNTYQKAESENKVIGGVGLSNLKRRLEILFPQKHKLLSSKDGVHYQATLKIELNGEA